MHQCVRATSTHADACAQQVRAHVRTSARGGGESRREGPGGAGRREGRRGGRPPREGRERVPEHVRERARAPSPPAAVGAGCHGNAPRPELIISWGKCAGGAGAGRERGGSGAGGAGGGVELPPAGGPGRAEPRALRRRRDPASARPVSRGPGRAGGGLGARGPPGLLFGVPRPGPPCSRDPLSGPAVERGEGAAGRPSPAPTPAPSSRSRGPCPEQGMGAARPLRSEQPRDPPSDFFGPGEPDPAGDPRACRPRALPGRKAPHPQGSLEGCSPGPPTTSVPWAVRFPPRGAGGGRASPR